jgi:uncharacterized membrane protein
MQLVATMPNLRLHPAETKELALPLVCACCSRPPVAYVKRTFTIKEKYPVFGLTIPAQSCDVHLPLCSDHETYWQHRARTRNRVFWFILLGAGWAWLVVTGGILLARALDVFTELGVEPAFALGFVAAMLTFLVGIVALDIHRLRTGIHVVAIDSGGIVLRGLGAEFRAALQRQRERALETQSG